MLTAANTIGKLYLTKLEDTAVLPPKNYCPVYLRLWPYFVLFFVASLFALAIAKPQTANISTLGEALGGAAFLAVLPFVIALPWRLIERRWRPTSGPITLAFLIWGILLFLTWTGMRAP